jgi:NAD(P)-dependent dehydrogenase (short-subunit alcohol dehydrogenase family)
MRNTRSGLLASLIAVPQFALEEGWKVRGGATRAILGRLSSAVGLSRDVTIAENGGPSRVALVTGASRGTGAEVARHLAAHGFDVVIHCREKVRRAEAVAAQVRGYGRQALVAAADLTEPAAAKQLIAQTTDAFGRLDLLILNASGGMDRGRPAGYATELNEAAQLRLTRAALPFLPRGGRVVFVTSHLAHFYGDGVRMYQGYEPVAQSKHAGEAALRAEIGALDARGASLVVVSGDVIEGTVTPMLLERVTPGLIEERRRIVGALPTVEQFGAAIASAAMDPGLRSGETVYVGSVEAL